MSGNLIELLVLGGIAVFLILRLKNVLGTRDGFEKPRAPMPGVTETAEPRREFEVIEGGPDSDITNYVEDGTDDAKALAAMKLAEPGFNVSEFLEGAKAAYEMILMGFEAGDMESIRPFLAPDVADTFDGAIQARAEQGLTVEANFVGFREIALDEVIFDRMTSMAEVSVRFTAELTSVVKDADGEVVEGSPTEIKKNKDVWTFGRTMGADNPNWQLVATGG